MMRKEAFVAGVDAFAAKRKTLLETTDERLQPHVKDALRRVGLPSWQMPIIREALDVFDETARTEVEEWGPGLDTLRNEFERELHEALDKTHKVDRDKFEQQVERVTRWISVMAINAGTEAATSTDPDPAVGLEWVSMEDEKVRPAHKEAHGQQVVSGKPFTVGGVKMLYPGQPVGDPENWINCRCVARPAMLEESASTVTAAGAPGVKKDGTPPVCKYCDSPATQYVLHSEGMAYVPACDEHIGQAKEDAAKSTPSGDADPSNIDRVASYAVVEEESAVEEEPPPIPDDEAQIQVPFYGVAAPEGIPSGDGRQFSNGALTNRPLPLPLKSMFIDDEGHKGSVIAGRIDKIWRDGNLIKYEGVFDVSEAAYETVRLIADGMWRGVSVDVDQAVGAALEDGTGVEFTEARIAAITVCAIPAFAEAWIALGSWADEETPVTTGETAEMAVENVPERTKDGPGWITHPEPTKDITSYWVRGPGAAKIRWGTGGDFNRCRAQLVKYVQNPEWLAGLCANLHYRALGIWPGRNAHAGEMVTMKMDEQAELPSVTLTASAAVAVSADYFRNPELTKPTPLTVTDDGRVFGHIAAWGVCHIANPEGEGICTTAPPSETDYSFFLTGEYITDAGRVPVGQISLGGGHADERLGMRAAMAHYDNTSSAVADITVGNDDHGIWFAGKLRDDVTDAQVHALRAAGKVSGDWRGVIVHGQESLELMAALAVNVPGFPIPRTSYAMDGDRQLSLIAAGIPAPEREELAPEFIAQMDAYNARMARKAQLAKLKDQGRALRAEIIRAKIEMTKEK